MPSHGLWQLGSKGGYGSCFTACDVKYSHSIKLTLWVLCTPEVAFGVQSEMQFAVSNLQQSSISPRQCCSVWILQLICGLLL